MTTPSAASPRPILQRAALLSALFAALMFGAGALLVIQAASGGGLLYMDNGFAVEPRDAAFALQFLALLVLPHMLAAMLPRPTHRRLARGLALVCNGLLLVAFPLSIEARLWSEASHVDGTPMYSSTDSSERVKSWDAFFGYVPVWKSGFRPVQGWTRYEGNDAGERHTYETNGLWGKRVVYALNRTALSDSPETLASDDSSRKVYECITGEAVHVLGFYWHNGRHSNVIYLPEPRLPKGRCTLIDMPRIGADLR